VQVRVRAWAGGSLGQYSGERYAQWLTRVLGGIPKASANTIKKNRGKLVMKAVSSFRHLSKLAVAIGALSAVPAMATNGYFTHGVGTHSKAMAGAGDASPTMAIDVANNPAAGILVKESVDVGVGVFSPARSYNTTDSLLNGNMGTFTLNTPAGGVESDNDYFFIPYVASNWHLSEETSLTVAFYGRGGMNTEYNRGSATFDITGMGFPPQTYPGTFGAGRAGVNLNQAFLELAFSAKVSDSVTVGIAPVIAYQMFKAEGLSNFAPYTKTFVENLLSTGMPTNPADLNLTDKGHDDSMGVGLKAGVIWSITDTFAVQAAYQTEIDMDSFDDYSDLFAEGGDFDIPATIRVGFSWAASDRLKLHFDVEETYYSKVASVANPMTNVAGCPTAGLGGQAIDNCLGGSNGFGFGWDDVMVYQVGLEWSPQGMENVTWRAGYNYGEQPISKENAAINILAPAVVEEHFTAGVSYDLDNDHQISVAVMYAPEKTVTGPNLFDPTQNVSLTMDQFEIEVAYTF